MVSISTNMAVTLGTQLLDTTFSKVGSDSPYDVDRLLVPSSMLLRQSSGLLVPQDLLLVGVRNNRAGELLLFRVQSALRTLTQAFFTLSETV